LLTLSQLHISTVRRIRWKFQSRVGKKMNRSGRGQFYNSTYRCSVHKDEPRNTGGRTVVIRSKIKSGNHRIQSGSVKGN